LGLRLTQGLDLAATCEVFGEDVGRFREPMAALEAAGLATSRAGWVTLTDRGLDVHSEAALRLM